MISASAAMTGSYDYLQVVLSVVIAISASYAALDLGGRVTAASGWVRRAWLIGGATAMGFGIWSMHFTGMLTSAWRPCVWLRYSGFIPSLRPCQLRLRSHFLLPP